MTQNLKKWYRSRGIDLVLPSVRDALAGGDVWVRKTGGPWTEGVGSVCGLLVAKVVLQSDSEGLWLQPALAISAYEVDPCFELGDNAVAEFENGLTIGKALRVAVVDAQRQWSFPFG